MTRRTRSGLRLSTLVVAAGLVLAACSSGGGSSASGASPAPASAPPATTPTAAASTTSGSGCASLAGLQGAVNDHGTQTLSGSSATLTAGDFYFDATCLTATGGGKVSVTVTNSGTALHNFSVTSLGIDQDVAAGATITVNVKLPDSGTLGFFCKYHSASGMVGAFVIQ